jgi:hypothetical protein
MIPLSYADQIVEGSFEYALNEIVEEHLDLSVFEHRYHNDANANGPRNPTEVQVPRTVASIVDVTKSPAVASDSRAPPVNTRGLREIS